MLNTRHELEASTRIHTTETLVTHVPHVKHPPRVGSKHTHTFDGNTCNHVPHVKQWKHL